jgi:hypothetical protein
MFDIDCLLEKIKWKTQKVATYKMVEGKRPLGRSRCGGDGNIRINHTNRILRF